MAINIQALSASVRKRLKEKKDEDIVTNDFHVQSTSTSSPLKSSINKALAKSGKSALTESPQQGTGFVKSILQKTPSIVKTVASSVGNFVKDQTKPGVAAKTVLWDAPKALVFDLPRAVLGGTYSAIKSVFEEASVRLQGNTRENVREQMSSPDLESTLFGNEITSWQQKSEEVNKIVNESSVATDWEKKNLAPIVGVVGFVSDAWIGGGGSAKNKIAKSVLEDLAKETEETAVKKILTNIKMPTNLIDEVAPKIVGARTAKDVDQVVKTGVKDIMKRAEETAPPDVLERGAKLISDEAQGAIDEGARTPVARYTVREASEADEPIKLFRGHDGQVDEVEKSFGKVLDVSGDQHQIIRDLAANGDEEAKKILKNPSDFYIKSDNLLREKFGGEVDAIRYGNVDIPQKGIEYHDLNTGQFFSESRDTAQVYALQSRGAKYVPGSENSMKLYRGDAEMIPFNELDPVGRFNPATKEARSAFANTPGIYFTTAKSDAEAYGKNITQAILKNNSKIINTSSKKLTRKEVERIVSKNKNLADVASNWSQDFIEGKKAIVDAIMSEKGGLERIKAIWAEAFPNDHAGFVDAMSRSGIDGLRVEKDGVTHYVVYNKEALSEVKAKPSDLAIINRESGELGIKEPYKNFSFEERVQLQEVNTSKAFKTPTEKTADLVVAQEFKDSRGKIARMRDSFIEQVQDDMIRVRRLVENKALKITDESNPYDAEILFHGRVGTRLEEVKSSAVKIDKDILKVARTYGVKDADVIKDVNEYLIARHAPERNAALGDGAAGMTTDEANALLARFGDADGAISHAAEVRQIADRIQEINTKTLDILKEGEVITDDLYETLRSKYKNHIPLYRVMAEEEDFAGGLGRGFDVKNTGIKRAKGSQREVMDIMGNVMFNVEQAIIRAEKNRVDLSTLKMVRDNADALKDMFKVRKPKVIGQTWSGQPITEMIQDPQILALREKGKPVLIEIKDPNLAIALKGIGREKLSGMMRGVAAITRFYSGLQTRFNPEFAFSNKIRDLQEVLVYAASKKEVGIRGGAKIIAKEARLQNVGAVLDHMRGKNSAGAKIYQQLLEDGGTTGGVSLASRGKVELDLAKIRKLNRSNPRLAASKTIEYIDKWNTIFEDSSRLSVYRTAIERGASRQRAAVLAKESSINFNKFGRQGKIINALWMFSNASIQGSMNTIRAMKNPKVAAAVGTTVLGSVYAVAEWNDNVDPDWRNKITTWDRLNSLAIMLPNQEGSGEGVRYITIPVGWGIKPIKVMADELVDVEAGKSEGIASAMSSVLASAVEAYNPAGGSDIISSVTPTVLDIPLELARNKSWSGSAIKPDWDRNAPASIQYFSSLRDSATGRTAIGLSKGLSGIGMEVSPADINYAYEQIIGGAGRFTNKTVNFIASVGKQEPLPAKDTPIVSRFYKTRPEEEVGQGASEFEQLSKILEEQSREKFYLSQQAEDSLRQLSQIPKEEAAKRFEEIKSADPELAAKITSLKKEQDKGLTFIDRKIIQLGVANGERASFLAEKFKALETDQDRANLWNEYKKKGIISDTVSKQIKELLKTE